MIPEITLNPIVKKLLKFKKARCPKSSRWHVNAIYWDDGDYELTLTTSWGDTIHHFVYRDALNKYYYYPEPKGIYSKMEELG